MQFLILGSLLISLLAAQYYVLAVSGSVANTVNSTDLGARSPNCLYLSGLVQFPITYEQLTQPAIRYCVRHSSQSFASFYLQRRGYGLSQISI